MSPEEFLACVAAVRRFVRDKVNMPNDYKIGRYWKVLGRMRM